MDPSDPIITLKAGQQLELLRVHQGVICQRSIFFRRALKPEWGRQRDNPHVLDMSDTAAHLLKDYIQWCYSGKFSSFLCLPRTDQRSSDRPTFVNQVEETFVALAEAYVFGDKVIDIKYKNNILDNLIAIQIEASRSPGPDCANIIVAGTTSTSPARRLLADFVAHNAWDDSHSCPVGWMDRIGDYPQELLADAMKTMLRIRLRSPCSCSSRPWVKNPAGYHEVDDT